MPQVNAGSVAAHHFSRQAFLLQFYPRRMLYGDYSSMMPQFFRPRGGDDIESYYYFAFLAAYDAEYYFVLKSNLCCRFRH